MTKDRTQAGATRYTHKKTAGSSHTRILQLAGPGMGRTCVDAGCATGYLAADLRGNGWRVLGIEPDHEAALSATSHCDEVINKPLEQIDFRVIGDYSAVILGDVLEHLQDPDEVLGDAVAALPRDGFIVASVPNVAFALVRLSLLIGRFNYSERGIMDRTHLHFFTRSSFRRFMVNHGLRIEAMEATVPPVELVLRGRARRLVGPLRELLIVLARLAPGLFAYQHVCKATKL